LRTDIAFAVIAHSRARLDRLLDRVCHAGVLMSSVETRAIEGKPDMTSLFPESILTWESLAGTPAPPRDPNDEDDEEEEMRMMKKKKRTTITKRTKTASQGLSENQTKTSSEVTSRQRWTVPAIPLLSA
jgi:hypothetical protein